MSGTQLLLQPLRCLPELSFAWQRLLSPGLRGGSSIQSHLQHDGSHTGTPYKPASTHQPCPSSSWHQLSHAHHVHTANLYSVKTGQPKPKPWPVLEPVETSGNQPGNFKWQRTVLRPQPEVQIVQQGNILILTGKAGSVKVDVSELDPTGLVAFKLMPIPVIAGTSPSSTNPGTRSIIILASPSKERFDAVVDALEKAIQGVIQGYLVGLTVKGVGYRLEPVLDDSVAKGRKYFEQTPNEATNITYPYNKPVTALRLRVGYSKPIIYPLPPTVRAFCLKPTLTYLYGLEHHKLLQLAQEIRGVRKPNVYTGNGIQILGEVVKTKQRSSRKAK